MNDHREDESWLSLSPSESTRRWLALARAQAGRRRPADLLNQFDRDSFVAPAPVDQRVLHRLDGLWLDAASTYEAVQLSPVAPLGCCSVVAPTSQDRTLTANRGTEVVSDPTNVLALECARRLRGRRDDVRLSTVHQVLRAQKLPPVEGYTQHFRLACLMESGPARPSDEFEVGAVIRVLEVFETVLETASGGGTADLPERRLTVRAADGSALGERVAHGLRAAFPSLDVRREPEPAAYYDGLRVTLDVATDSGDFIPLGDVGRFDWVARLLANRKMRCVAAGFGLQLLLALAPEVKAVDG